MWLLSVGKSATVVSGKPNATEGTFAYELNVCDFDVVGLIRGTLELTSGVRGLRDFLEGRRLNIRWNARGRAV